MQGKLAARVSQTWRTSVRSHGKLGKSMTDHRLVKGCEYRRDEVKVANLVDEMCEWRLERRTGVDCAVIKHWHESGMENGFSRGVGTG